MSTRHRLDWHARLSQSREVSFHRAQAHSKLPREHGTSHRLLDCTEKLDEPLLPLHPSKGEVVVT
jgi:hypothetical protein